MKTSLGFVSSTATAPSKAPSKARSRAPAAPSRQPLAGRRRASMFTPTAAFATLLVSTLPGVLRTALTTALLVALPAGAVVPVGVRGGAVPHGAARPPTAAAATAPTLDLVAGTLVSVDASKKTMKVGEESLTWQSAKLRVFGAAGNRMTENDLKAGAKVRFALEPGVKDGRQVVLVYVDGRP